MEVGWVEGNGSHGVSLKSTFKIENYLNIIGDFSCEDV